MSEAEERLITKALKALDAPNNEPLRWLIDEGEVARIFPGSRGHLKASAH